MIVSMAWSRLGMEADVAPVISPAASRETAVYEGPVSIDNPISVMDITVDYEIDNSLITAYNDANGTDYKAAPADLVSLAATSSQLEAGKSSTAFSLQILSEKLFNGNELKAVDDNQYLVPVRIKSLSNEAIGISRSVMYVPVSFNREVIGPWTLLEGDNNAVTLVVDIGKARVFTKFLISDYTTHQGNYREYEIYIADKYNGASTQWTLVADW